MTDADILASLSPVRYEPSCIVFPDDSAVVRHAQPLDDTARAHLREQAIARLARDPEAVAARERRIAVTRAGGKVLPRRRTR